MLLVHSACAMRLQGLEPGVAPPLLQRDGRPVMVLTVLLVLLPLCLQRHIRQVRTACRTVRPELLSFFLVSACSLRRHLPHRAPAPRCAQPALKIPASHGVPRRRLRAAIGTASSHLHRARCAAHVLPPLYLVLTGHATCKGCPVAWAPAFLMHPGCEFHANPNP